MIEAMMAIPPKSSSGGGGDPIPGGNDFLMHFDSNVSDVYGKAFTNSGLSIQSSVVKYGAASGWSGTNNPLAFSTPFTVTGDFTVDFWGYQTAWTGGSYPCIMYDQAQNIQLHLDTPQGSIGGYWAGPRPVSASGLYALNTWNHFAFVRSGTNFLCFINGGLCVNFNLGGVLTVNFNYIVGPNGYSFPGYLDEFAIKRSAKWTSNFTPPTGPYST